MTNVTLRYKNSQHLSIMLMLVATLAMLLMAPMSAFAQGGGVSDNPDSARAVLVKEVAGELKKDTYTLDGGGTVSGAQLFTTDKSGKTDVNEAVYGKLDASSKSEFVTRLAESARKVANPDDKLNYRQGVTEKTVGNWFKELQSKKGMGSRMMAELTKNIKPNFVEANSIAAGFADPVNIFTAFLIITLIMLLGTQIATDITYITLPIARALINGEEGDSKVAKMVAKFVGPAAKRAVRKQEDGSKTFAGSLLGWMFEWSFAIITLGVCIYLLITGKIFDITGWVIDAWGG